ncbi:MAG: hypothetical protein V1721_07880 [Pseudomonadota bacterium]
MLFEIIGIAMIVAGIVAVIFKLEDAGRKSEQRDQMKKVLDDIHAADMVRDRLRRDADDAKRVRERFTR